MDNDKKRKWNIHNQTLGLQSITKTLPESAFSLDHQTQDAFHIDNTHRELNSVQLNAINAIVATHPVVHTCMAVIINRLVENGISFLDGTGKSKELDPQFQNMVNDKWIKFVIDCVWCLHIQGVVPVCVGVFQDNNQEPYPYVPLMGSYVIKIEQVRGNQIYHFYWKPEFIKGLNTNFKQAFSMERDDNVMIYTMPGSEPDVNGLLNSKFSVLISAIAKINAHEECASKADEQLCNPEQYIRTDSKSIVDFANLTGNKQNRHLFADEDPSHASDDAYFVVEPEFNRIARARNQFSRINPAQHLNAGWRDDRFLSVGESVERADRAQFNQKIVELKTYVRELVCTVLGVPPSVIYDKHEVRGNLIGQNVTLDMNVKSIARLIECILTDAYTAIYGRQEQEQARTRIIQDSILKALDQLRADSAQDTSVLERIFNSNTKDLNKDEAQNEERIHRELLAKYTNPLELKAKLKRVNENKIRLSLQIRSSSNPSSLVFLNARGILSYTKFAELMLKKHGLTIADLDKKEDTWTLDELKQLAGTNLTAIDDVQVDANMLHSRIQMKHTTKPKPSSSDIE